MTAGNGVGWIKKNENSDDRLNLIQYISSDRVNHHMILVVISITVLISFYSFPHDFFLASIFGSGHALLDRACLEISASDKGLERRHRPNEDILHSSGTLQVALDIYYIAGMPLATS